MILLDDINCLHEVLTSSFSVDIITTCSKGQALNLF